MGTSTLENKDSLFLENMQGCYESSLHDDLLNTFRIKAWDRFLELGLPQKKTDSFFSNIRDLYGKELSLACIKKYEKNDIKTHILPESLHSHIVFVNGHLEKELSDISAYDDADLYSLNEAMETFGIYLQGRFLKNINQEKDPFAILNTAIYSKGAFFYLSSYQKTKNPLQIIHIIEEKQAYYCPRVQLYLSDETHLDCINTYVIENKDTSFFYNYMMDISLGRKAKFCISTHQKNDSRGFLFEGLRAEVKKEAKLDAIIFSQGKNIRHDYQVQLLETKAEAKLSGLALLENEDFCKTNILIHHKAEECLSDQLFKSVLNGMSEYNFSGKIFVDPIAQKTLAYQLNQNLLLSDQAVCQSKPNLEILADDVKASHGMTATELKEDQLFYLASRGISKKEAKDMLIQGFCKTVIDKCPIPSLKKKMIDEL